jgi:acyl CoA:acetate/3-ketoacid CoA transferase alpha subunit
MEILDSGIGELFHVPDPDGHRAYIRENKKRALVDKVMTEQEAVKKYVSDGDYLCYDCTMLMRGPSSLVREVIRQKKKNLGLGGRFTYMIVILMVAAGCVNRVDIGYIGVGAVLKRMLDQGVRIAEWSNSRDMRCSGSPESFIPIRFLWTSPHYSAKINKDPWGDKEVVLVPALNPDVGLIHVHQCDIYGNARIFGPSVSPLEIATASKKVIISTEEIIDTEYIRRDPGRTSIPYYLVDAVAKRRAHPGEVAGVYASDPESIFEMFRVAGDVTGKQMEQFLEKTVYSLANHKEYLEKRVGLEKMLALKRRATIKQGYS